MLKLYNTLSRKKEAFKPLKNKKVGLYTCGPTVYLYAHIGNLRTYIFEDVLKKVLEYNGYKVKHVMNITDVGHLTSEADTGEDKVELGAKRERKTAWEIAEFYTDAFKKDVKRLNIKEPDIWVKATETIEDQLNLIKILEKKGFTYRISDGIYFDTSKLKNYGRLWPQKMKLKAGARIEMVPGKKNPTDFALWKFTPKGVKRQMEWDSPWAPPGVRGKVKGFPGWHTECVVMSMKYLGVPFDIHCGGVDHISIHHTNEIAQAEAAFSKILANFWLHGEFLVFGEEKMAKSKGKIITLENLIEKGYNPLAYRYLCLTTHYRKKLQFSWPALKSAQNALNGLYQKIIEIKTEDPKNIITFPRPSKSYYLENYREKFLNFINDDLNMPKALALLWNVIKDERLKIKDKKELVLDFDKIFGLDLAKVKKPKIPREIIKLVQIREKYRKKGDFKSADEIRKKVKKIGWQIEDTKEGPKLKKL